MKIGTTLVSALIAILLAPSAFAQRGSEAAKANLIIQTDLGKATISRHIYGHFSEHLGRCIYGGYWWGKGARYQIPVVSE
jgi:hypothetical protein